jgi:hypothetical protein
MIADGWAMPAACPHGITSPPSPVVIRRAAESARKTESVPVDRWPAWVAAIAALRRSDDRGVGDTVHRLADSMPAVLRNTGIALKQWLRGSRSCGCAQDRARLNALYPYG